MPGGDRTGPLGLGPMTGRAAGYCAGYSVPGYANPISGRGRGFGFGCGWGTGRIWGRGRSLGRGYGRGFGWQWTAYPYSYGDPSYPAEINPQQEAEMLKEQAKAMQEEINAINQHIKDLESAQASKDSK